MRRINIDLSAILRPRGSGEDAREVSGFCNRRFLDLRIAGAIAASMVGLVWLVDREPAKEIRPRLGRGEVGVQIESLAFSPTGERLATTNTFGRVAIRAKDRGWEIERFLDFPGQASAVAYSPDGRSLAAVGYEPGLCLWDLDSGTSQPAKVVASPVRRAWRVRFAPDGQSIAVTSDFDGTVLVWDIATQRERIVLHHTSPVSCVAFSPDGRWLATAGRNKHQSIALWDLRTGGRRVLLENGTGPALSVAFSPDGALLASASVGEPHVRLWNLKERLVCRVFAEQVRSVNSVAFHPDGSLLATASNDGTLGLWEVATGQCRARVDSHATSLRSVAFSPDGRTLALATLGDDDVRFWDLVEILSASSAERLAATERHSNQTGQNSMKAAQLAGTSTIAGRLGQMGLAERPIALPFAVGSPTRNAR